MANGYLSDYFADLLIRAWLTHDVSALPYGYDIGLTLELPSDQNGTGIVIPEQPEYNTVRVNADSSSWISMGSGSRSMEIAVDVVYETASEDWGEINGYTFSDQGIFLGFGITNPYTILADMKARLPAGTVILSLPLLGAF
jgi:hypothetical protein